MINSRCLLATSFNICNIWHKSYLLFLVVTSHFWLVVSEYCFNNYCLFVYNSYRLVVKQLFLLLDSFPSPPLHEHCRKVKHLCHYKNLAFLIRQMVSNKNSIFHFRDFTKCLQKILQKLSRKFYIFKRIEAVSHILFNKDSLQMLID